VRRYASTIPLVIRPFRHAGLERFFLTGNKSGDTAETCAASGRATRGSQRGEEAGTDECSGLELACTEGSAEGHWSVKVFRKLTSHIPLRGRGRRTGRLSGLPLARQKQWRRCITRHIRDGFCGSIWENCEWGEAAARLRIARTDALAGAQWQGGNLRGYGVAGGGGDGNRGHALDGTCRRSSICGRRVEGRGRRFGPLPPERRAQAMANIVGIWKDRPRVRRCTRAMCAIFVGANGLPPVKSVSNRDPLLLTTLSPRCSAR